jgi:outer membrane protein OmpA-like peptidoglycan-associated protein
VDGRSLDPLTGHLKIIDLTNNRLIASVSGQQSTSFNALRGREYAITGTSDGFVNNTVNFSPTTLPEGEALFIVNVPLYKLEQYNAVIVVNNEQEDQLFYGHKELVEYHGSSGELREYLKDQNAKIGIVDTIRNIYYDFDKWNIREDAAKELDRLAGLLSKNGELKFSLYAHTDKRGSDPYNDKLADRRVESARKYLQIKGIDSNRISIESFGEKILYKECESDQDCNEPTHQSNRRTEIRLTSYISNMVIK